LLLAGLPAGASGLATITTLAVTSGGTAVTTVTLGSVVVLSATVKVGGITTLTVGQVNFCDATAAHCTDIHILGTAQLTKAGTATYKFRPGVGSHSYVAVFAGTTSDASSTSATEALTVTPPAVYPSFTAIAQSGTVGNYMLTATVGGTGSAAPTGTVSFLDSSNSNAVLGTAALGGNSGLSFLNTLNLSVSQPFAVAVADFNGDGIPDLAVGNGANNSVAIFLGNGDGTFTQAANSPVTVGGIPFSIAAGDFNLDGIPDLAIANAGSSTMTILLGNGDGTFKQAANSPVTVGNNPHSVAVGDFNGDGIPDLVTVGNTSAGTVTTLLGKGDGTFTQAANSPFNVGTFPQSVAAGDFNGDGILDLAVTNSTVGTVTILLGNGDGTFTQAANSPIVASSYVYSIVVGDFNRNGILDLAVTNGENNTVTILLGKGDGTFTQAAKSPISVGSDPFPIAVGDFNGDGIPDLAVGNSGNGTVTILLGNGDGTFTQAANSPLTVGNDPFSVAVSDFNGDGTPDLAVSTSPDNQYTQPNNDVSVMLTATQAATATSSGIYVPVATGANQVIASYPGNGNYKSSTSTSTVLTAATGKPSVSVAASPNPTTYGTSVTLTATMTGSGLTPTGTATFLDGTTQLGTSTLNSSGIATFTSSTSALGAHTITVSYGGDTNYNGATSSAVTLTITGMVTPTVVVTPSSSGVTTAQAFTVTVTVNGGNGNPTATGSVTLTSGGYSSAATTLSSGTTTISMPAGSLAVGTDTLTATYTPDAASSSTYKSATGTGSVLVVSAGKATPTVVVTPPSYSITTMQSLSVTIAVSDEVGNPVPTGSVTLSSGSYTSAATTLVSGSATINIPAGSLAPGTVTLTASYSPDSNSSSTYNSATGASSAVTVTPVAPTITFTVANHTYGDAPFTVSATSNSSGAITYSMVSGPATVSGSTVTLTGAGTVVLQASQAAAGNYAAGTQNATFTVATEAQTITFTAPTSPVTYGVPPITLSATSTSGLAVVFSVVSGPGTVSGSTLTITGVGTIVVAANQVGNTSYTAATQVTQSIVVNVAGTVATPTFSPVAGTYTAAQAVTISDSTTGTTIYYTTNGSTPTTSSTVYSGAITVSATEMLEAIATATGYTTSVVATAAYTLVNPQPAISSLSPAFTNAGGATFTLTVNGSGFISGSTVYWGASALTTTYVNATQLTAQVPATDISATGTNAITVQTPAPGGGTSNTWQFEVDSASSSSTAPTITSASETVAAGSTASYPVTVPSSVTSISVSCLNLPAGATCSYSTTTNSVTIATTSTTPKGTYQIIVVFTETVTSAGFLLPLLLLPLAFIRRKSAARGIWITACLGLVLLASAALTIGCGSGGGGGSSTPPATQQVTSSSSVSLTIQ
jgi:hypothetical protein